MLRSWSPRPPPRCASSAVSPVSCSRPRLPQESRAGYLGPVARYLPAAQPPASRRPRWRSPASAPPCPPRRGPRAYAPPGGLVITARGGRRRPTPRQARPPPYPPGRRPSAPRRSGLPPVRYRGPRAPHGRGLLDGQHVKGEVVRFCGGLSPGAKQGARRGWRVGKNGSRWRGHRQGRFAAQRSRREFCGATYPNDYGRPQPRRPASRTGGPQD